MNIKNLINSIFAYTPPMQYTFSLSGNNSISNNQDDKTMKKQTQEKVFPSLNVNLEYMKTRYNLLINSDVIFREFTINARGKQYNSFIVYIDGMVDSQIMNQFIIEPLMLRNKNNQFEGSQNKVISEAVTNNITVRKIKKFDLSNYLMGCLLPQNAVKEVSNFNEISGRYKCTEIVLYLLIL